MIKMKIDDIWRELQMKYDHFWTIAKLQNTSEGENFSTNTEFVAHITGEYVD